MDAQSAADFEQHFLAESGAGDDVVEALLKVKLAHAEGTTLLVPDLIAADLNGWHWFAPKFFTACWLQFAGQFGVAAIGVDFSEAGPRVLVKFASTQFVRRYEDGAQLYRCFVCGARAAALMAQAAGRCEVSEAHDILLTLHHHTTDAAASAIAQSRHFRGSAWNIQGTRKLRNVEFAYFTSLPRITHDLHLQRIGMASNGWMHFLPTNGSAPHDVISIPVYRESTLNRRATLNVKISAAAITSQHVYRHSPRGEPTYYEICHPEILRVGLVPGTTLAFDGSVTNAATASLKRFDYVVLGDADTREGLLAPYDEEETRSVLHIERCDSITFFEFWRRHANSDQVSGRTFEALTLQQREK